MRKTFLKMGIGFLLTGLVFGGCQAQTSSSVPSGSQQTQGLVPAVPYSNGPTSPPSTLKGPKGAPPVMNLK